MSDLDHTDSNYESDEYYDEQGRRVEFDCYTGMISVMPKWEPMPEINVTESTFKEDVDISVNGSFHNSAHKAKYDDASGDLNSRPTYTLDEMTPIIQDPRCKSKSNLNCFWPVYVGNFHCENRNDEFDCVKKYFAWKGLHVRWWYRRVDQYYYDFQSKVGVYDMLVYFVSEQDANRAIEQCHRDKFKGYQLNVFPGREPVFFDPSRSLYAQNMKSGKVYSDLFFEKHVRCKHAVNVTCAIKYDIKNGAIEFERGQDMQKVFKSERLFKFEVITSTIRKQRFLEHEVLEEIEHHLAYHHRTLEVDPNEKHLKLLLQGKRPFVDPEPKKAVTPFRSGPPRYIQQRRLATKNVKIKKKIARALASGRKPKCFGSTKAAKMRFKRMVEQVQRDYNNN